MDLLQSPEIRQVLARKVILPHFLVDNKLTQAMQKYDLWNGMALVGGLFSHSQILQKHEFYVVFEAMKRSIDTGSFIYLKHSLPSDPRLMGVQLVERIKLVGLAMIELQKDPNVSNSLRMNVLTVNLQPVEQSFWEAIGEVNSNLDWLLDNSEV